MVVGHQRKKILLQVTLYLKPCTSTLYHWIDRGNRRVLDPLIQERPEELNNKIKKKVDQEMDQLDKQLDDQAETILKTINLIMTWSSMESMRC